MREWKRRLQEGNRSKEEVFGVYGMKRKELNEGEKVKKQASYGRKGKGREKECRKEKGSE